jgi:hypothetical protein
MQAPRPPPRTPFRTDEIPRTMTSAPKPETSVVVRAFNEERWLPEVFSALARQRYRDFEVILVDSGSLDRTREIAEENGARIVRMRSEDFTFGHSLNVGIRESQGEFIAMLSAHAIPANDHWLEDLVAPLRQPKVAMVYGGPARPRGLEVLGVPRLRAGLPGRAHARHVRRARREQRELRDQARALARPRSSTRGCRASRTSSGHGTGRSAGITWRTSRARASSTCTPRPGRRCVADTIGKGWLRAGCG